jgi:hypothetical protein
LTQSAIGEVFPNDYHLSAHCPVSMDKAYVVHMDLKGDTNVAIGLSSNAIAFFDKEPI